MKAKHFLPILTCIALLIILVTFVTTTWREQSEEQRRQDAIADALHATELEKLKEIRAQQEKERLEKLEKNNTYTVYQRFEERSLNIHVLYIGDEVMYGAGVEPRTQSFRILLRNMYKKYFNPNIIGTELTPKKGENMFNYSREAILAFTSLYDLHLTYISIGSDESYTNYAYNYELLVRTAKLPRAKDDGEDKGRLSDVVCIIQHDQTDEDAEAIIAIAEYYGVICVDMRGVFDGKESQLLTKDGLPNIKGNEAYADEIFPYLKKAITEQKETTVCPEEMLYSPVSVKVN